MLKKYDLQTEYNDVINITDQVKEAVSESGVKSGLCLVFNPHTTASMTVTSFWDPKGFEDLQDEICRLIPTKVDFKHQHDTPQDAAGHVKSSLLEVEVCFIVGDEKLLFGGSQVVFCLDFDGPRKRKFYVKVIEG